METKIVAIHQPNFFPWLGYFDKISRSKTFVFLDDVQFPKKGGVWSNRVKLLLGGSERWVTAPIERNYSGLRKINEMSFSNSHPWREKLLKSLVTNYKKHPFFDETMELVETLVVNRENNISNYNIHAITEIVKKLGFLDVEIIKSSDYSSEFSSNEMLCFLTAKAGGNTYLCGAGAEGYQDPNIFNDFGLILQHQNFQHPHYKQHTSDKFISGLSVIDAAMNVGWSGVHNLIRASSQ